jgi:AraC-like DNA-binding protein
MIHVEHHTVRGSSPDAPSYEVSEIRSHHYRFARLRSSRAGMIRLAPPAAPRDYLLSVNWEALPVYESAEDGVLQRHEGMAADKICLIPGHRDVALVLEQPFNLLRFYNDNARQHPYTPLQNLCAQTDPVLLHLLKSIQPVFDQPDQIAPSFIHHVAEALDVYLRGAYGGGTGNGAARQRQGTLSAQQLDLAKDALLASVGRDFSIREVADRCGLSSSYFSFLFKNSTGHAPLNWLLQRRLETARHLLATTSQPLLDVAKACGFADQSHFTRIFSRTLGIPPGQWRQLHRQAPPRRRDAETPLS